LEELGTIIEGGEDTEWLESIATKAFESTECVDDFAGFNFHKEGETSTGFNIYTFECLRGTGVCIKKESDRFKWSAAYLLDYD